MHKVEVCHRDLKLENLVLDSDFNLKMIDFGMACPLTGSADDGFCAGEEKVGTPSYMAPEIYMGCDYQPVVADLYALGVIFFALATGVYPFAKATPEDGHYKYFF